MSEEKKKPDNPGQGGPPNVPPGLANKEVVFTIPRGEKPTAASPFKVVEKVVREESLKSIHKSISDLEQNVARMKRDKEDAIRFYDRKIKEAEETIGLAKKALTGR